MPTECERTNANTQQQTVPQTQQQQQQQQQELENALLLPAGENCKASSVEEEGVVGQEQRELTYDDMEAKELNGSKMSTSQTSITSQTSTTSSTNGHSSGNNTNGVGKKTSIISPDPTPYVTKERVTRPTPPPPPYNPMQFVQIKPCNLYQTAQEQLKKAEEVKKIKEIKKEDPEDWQNNLDNWKSSRRKRVEHIIDRVVEVKKLELEEHDRTRRKSKTFSEMIEERGERGARGRVKLATLAVYNEDESNDLSDLGIGTSSASGKSSQSEDYDNNSVLSDNAELDKAIQENNQKPTSIPAREYISSPGYDTSSSTAPGSSPDPCEYTYEGAIQDYKQRVSRASAGSVLANYKNNTNSKTHSSKETTSECKNTPNNDTSYPTRRGSKIEDRLMGFEVTSPSDSQEGLEKKVDVPKIDISKRKEIFENQNANTEPKSLGNSGTGAGNIAVPRVTLRDRFKLDETANGNGEIKDSTLKREVKRLSGDITSVRSRMQSLEQQQNLVNSTNGFSGGKTSNSKLVDIPVPPLKERLSSLQNAATKEEVKKAPVALVDARQLEIMKNEEEQRKKQIEHEQREQVHQNEVSKPAVKSSPPLETLPSGGTQETVVVKIVAPEEEVDRDDSGIHTADGETDEQELQLNAAIAALALEEQQLTEAANAVNQFEAEFDELSTSVVNAIANDLAVAAANTSTTNEQPCEMEFSVSSTNKSKSLLQPNSSLSSVKMSSFAEDDTNDDKSSSSRSVTSFGDQVANNVIKAEPEVLGKNTLTIAATSSLQRKPSNEMVHARNLLRMFKETFKSDIELDEAQEEQEVKPIADAPSSSGAIPKTRNVNAPPLLPKPLLKRSADIVRAETPQQRDTTINTQIFQSSSMSPTPLSPNPSFSYTQHSATPIAIPQKPTTPAASTSPTSVRAPTPPPRSSPSALLSNGGLSMIPRAINPIGKPPMSPKSSRYNVGSMQSPVNSPTPTRKATAADNNSPFSINGRVEIFNSKNMSNTTNPIGKPPTPTLSARKSYAPHLGGATTTPTSPLLARSPSPSPMNATHGNGVGFPKQQQQHPATVTALPTTAEALPTSTNQMSQATAANVAAPAKSMPSAQAVTEPSHETRRLVLNVTAGSPHTPQQQNTEVVMCAPPITILNPDELPKPNTVKVLSSCFSHDGKAAALPLPGPKPMPRSRIPQQTPPQSPTPAKRNFPSAPITNTTAPITNTTVKEFTQPETISKEEQAQQPQTEDETDNMAASYSSSLVLSTDADALKKLSMISDTSTMSSDCSTYTGPFETTAVVHTPPVVVEQSKELQRTALKPFPLERNSPLDRNKPTAQAVRPTGDPLKPNDSLTPLITVPSEMPMLVSCKPNASTLFKLTSPPASPHSPRSPVSPTAVSLCSNFLDSFEPTNSFLPTRQQAVGESPCDKVDVNDLPPNKRPPCTFYKDISAKAVKKCDESGKETVNVSNMKPPQAQRQHTVEEKVCQKIDINDLPPFDQVPLTGYDEVSAEEVRRCDGLNASAPNKAANTSLNNIPNSAIPTKSVPSTPTESSPTNNAKSHTVRPNSKPNSPIMAARAAHSRALIDTCERIIAEERLHSSQMKSALPASVPKSAGTPILQRKSKIPKPIPCCVGGSDSMNQADQQGKPVLAQPCTDDPPTPESVDENMVIGRLHVVETQIKVTTTTPPTSPPVTPKAGKKVAGAQQQTKKTKNIFDFLRRNFGLGDDHSSSSAAEDAATTKAHKAEVKPKAAEVVPAREKYTLKTDEIITVDNSKFYLPTDDTTIELTPPPLPKTPAPVNIEITKTFTTDEIVQGGTSEQALVEEINDLLDDELNKLT